MSHPDLAQYTNHKYLNLETYRKNGQAMLTPVWFVEDQGVLYVRTVANSGKVKRIRNNGHVRVAPCDVRGGLLGKWIKSKARLVDEATAERVNTLLKRKYGLMKSFFDLLSRLNQAKDATIAIELVEKEI